MKVSGENFQSWAEFQMLLDGLTVLVGPSNKGKSAIYRAIKALLRNEAPDSFIRNGQDAPLKITLELEDQSIEMTRKRKGSTKYTITPIPHKFYVGEDRSVLYGSREDAEAHAQNKKVSLYQDVYTSLGGKLPDEIVKLGFGEVKVGEYTLDPIFSGQNKAQFLIDSDRWKSSELSAILGAFSSTEKLDAGKKAANLRITQGKSEASTLAAEIRSAEERVTHLLDTSVGITPILDIVKGLEIDLRRVEGVSGVLTSLLYHKNRLTPLQEIMEAITLPDLTEVELWADKAQNARKAVTSLINSQQASEVVSGLDGISTAWSSLVLSVKQTNALDSLLDLLDKPSHDPTSLSQSLGGVIVEIETQLLEGNSLVSSIHHMGAAYSAREHFDKLTLESMYLEPLIEEAENEVEVIRNEMAAEATKGMCSKCGSPLEHTCQ